MGKQPAFQFYTGDWLKDPSLSMCSSATRGIWIDFLCRAHESARSGQITGTPEQFARLCRCTAAEFVAAANELHSTGAALIRERDGIYTLTNRRMKREADEREGARERKQTQRSREKKQCHAPVSQRQRLPVQQLSGCDPPASQKSHANVTSYSSSSSSSSFLPSEENVTSPASVFVEVFGKELSIYQQEQLVVISDLAVWQQTLSDWKLNQYSPKNLAGMIQSYRANVVKPAQNGSRGNNGAYVGSSTSESAKLIKPAEMVKVDLPPLPPEPDYFTQFKREVEKRINPESYATWFRPLGFVSLDDFQLTIRIPDRVFEDWILNNYTDVISEAFEAAGIEAQSIVFEAAVEPAKE